MDIESVLRWAPLAAEVAPLYGLSVTTVLAVIHVESAGDPDLVHPAFQATGLMQVVPSPVIAGRPGVEELKDPATNLRWGCYLLRLYWDSGGSLYGGLHQYSGGSYWQEEGGWSAFSRRYWTPFMRAKLEIVAALAERGDIIDREFHHHDRRCKM